MFPGNRTRAAREGQGRRPSRLLPAALVVLVMLGATGCRQKMANQARYDPYEASDFFADGMAARPRLDGTVARGELSTDPFFDTGRIGAAVGNGFPSAVKIDRALVDRGHERYDIYCSQCHGRLGDGNGMIPARGFRRPPSFHTETLRRQPTGHYFDVMTNGFGSMPPYKTMIPAADRWAIVAYIRALQLSQNVNAAELPQAERAKLDAPPPAPAPAPSHGGGH